MKKAINILINIGALIFLWCIIEWNYMPYLFVFVLIAIAIYNYKSAMKSIKISSTISDGLRSKKMNISLFTYLILFFLIKELYQNGFADLYYLTILLLLGLICNIESYLNNKHQKIVFYIEGHKLHSNETFPSERNIQELIAVNFHFVGNYYVLVFENKSSLTIYRNEFITLELNNFINQILSKSSQNVKVAYEAKEKLQLHNII
ncbi:hypothetical protein [Flavobacterium sp.]|uniref:hypothetical protein n=1 Tax=Flavobacterium sp. TaxID=239 RepID=UPI002630B409|nr:hypothetical protein [Flavobacterium sp.]